MDILYPVCKYDIELNSNLNAITVRALQTTWGQQLRIPMGPGGELTNGIVIINAEAIYLIWQSGTWGSWHLSLNFVWGNSATISTAGIDKNLGSIVLNASADCTMTYIGW